MQVIIIIAIIVKACFFTLFNYLNCYQFRLLFIIIAISWNDVSIFTLKTKITFSLVKQVTAV